MDFGYLFCRFCSFYSTDFETAMNTPVHTFFFMLSCINRISAEQDLRLLAVQQYSTDPKASKEFRKQLVIQMGSVSENYNQEREENATERLRNLIGGK